MCTLCPASLSWPPPCCVSVNLFVHHIHPWSLSWHCGRARDTASTTLIITTADPVHICATTVYALVHLCSLYERFIQRRVLLIRQANALTTSSTSIWQDRDKTVQWKHRLLPQSAAGKLYSALTPALLTCFRDNGVYWVLLPPNKSHVMCYFSS